MSYTLAEIRNGTGFEPGTRFEIARVDGGQVEVTFRKEVTPDDHPDLSWLDQTDKEMGEGFEAESQKRKDAYARGDWHMVGVRAVADITIVRKGRTATYTLRSPGVWGVESDSSEEYLQEIFNEECTTLRADIDALCAQQLVAYRSAARATLQMLNIGLGQDFHTLSITQVDSLLVEADRVKYRQPPNANGSRARYFHELLQRRARAKTSDSDNQIETRGKS